MSWSARIPVDEAARRLREARAAGFDDDALVFHDLDRLRHRLALLRDAFPTTALHTVAIKANPVLGVLRAAVAAGAGLEAASWEEVQLAVAAGCAPERIVYDSPAKTRAELRAAVAAGVWINADNLDEIARLDDGPPAAAGLRVNPGTGAGSIAMTSTVTRGGRFGVPLDTHEDDVVAAFASRPWLRGLHVHTGSQGVRLDQLVAAATRVAALKDRIEDRTGRALAVFDLGGGLPAVYREGAVVPTPAEWAAALADAVPALFSGGTRLVTELGRALHAGCGFLASRVEYVDPERRQLVLHVGADALLRPVYRPESWAHELALLDAAGVPKVGDTAPWLVGGPLCFAGDVIARDAPLPPVEVGDHVIVRDAGAYTIAMWSRHCSRGMPAVLGVDADRLVQLKARETAADVVRAWG